MDHGLVVVSVIEMMEMSNGLFCYWMWLTQ